MFRSSSLRCRRDHTWLSALFSSLILSACQTPQPSVDRPTTISHVPATEAPATAPGKRYIVDPQASEIRLLVYRDGPMARFGHNHAIVGRMHGNIAAGGSGAATARSFHIEVPVESFEVDLPGVRAEEGGEFAAEVSDAARNGTKANMLGADVLDAAHHPLIRIESVALVGPRWNSDVTARVSLRGTTRELKFAAAAFQGADALTVIAAFRIRQSEFGIAPFSILGGAVRVRDAIDVRVRLVARTAPQ